MLIVFAYHSLSNSEFEHSTSPEDFARQMEYLRAKARIIALSEMETLVKGGRIPKGVTAALTFDDGFEDHYQHAFPVLKRLQIPATFFIATDLVGKQRTYPSGYTFPMLSWDQISEMKASGLINFCGHTHTHPVLVGMDSNAVEQEILTARKILQTRLSTQDRYFAYPKGLTNATVSSVVRQYYTFAFRTEGVVFNTVRLDPMRFPRVTITKDITMKKFQRFLSPLYWRLRNLKRRLYARQRHYPSV